eukprot:TRINITY_DN74955_c0_g1_i1.p1 TRINITY_DN74955_c0_g1~~TRINITY_DN74955_c0_g1_i1.p1  ORF type:complete len:575 (+),score=73.21 TRINITY_DN74955_c0_g1_i1:81-1805(+)
MLLWTCLIAFVSMFVSCRAVSPGICPGHAFPACVRESNCESNGMACEHQCLHECTATPFSLQNGLGRGAKAALSQEFLNRAKDAAVPILLQYLQGLEIPKDVPGDIGNGVHITNIHDFAIQGTPDASLKLQSPDSVVITISSLAVDSIRCDASWSFYSTGAGASFNEAKLQLTLTATPTASGQVEVNVMDISVDLGSFEFHVDNSIMNWIVKQIVLPLIGVDVQPALESGIQNALSGVATSITQFLDGFSYQEPLDFLPAPFDRSLIDFHFADIQVARAVDTGDAYLQAGATGDVRDKAAPSTPTPLTPTPLTDFTEQQLNNRLVAAKINNFTLDTALYTFYRQGLWKYELGHNDLPDHLQELLETNSSVYRLLLPQLLQKFGAQNMVLKVEAASEPHVEIMPDRVKLIGDMALSFLVKPNSISRAPISDALTTAFALACPAQFDATAHVNQSQGPIVLIPTISTDSNCVLKERASVVGTFGVELLAALSDSTIPLLREAVIPKVNVFLNSNPVQVPVLSFDTPAGQLKISFENATLELEAGVATASVDVRSEVVPYQGKIAKPEDRDQSSVVV